MFPPKIVHTISLIQFGPFEICIFKYYSNKAVEYCVKHFAEGLSNNVSDCRQILNTVPISFIATYACFTIAVRILFLLKTCIGQQVLRVFNSENCLNRRSATLFPPLGI
jgi:hypothetical protein